MYPEHNQLDPDNPDCREESAYPANPDSEYGWEKLFSERLYFAYNRNHGIPVRVARYHNIFGPEGTWNGGREKAPAASAVKSLNSRRMVDLSRCGEMGHRLVPSCSLTNALKQLGRLMDSEFIGPVNIGSGRDGYYQSTGRNCCSC